MTARPLLRLALPLCIVGPLATGAAVADDRALLNALSDLGPDRLAAFVSRPLFAPSRHAAAEPAAEPSPDPAATPPPDTEAAPPSLHLTGIIESGSDVAAFARDGETPLTLRLGDAVGDWTVSAIDATTLTLTLGDRSADFRLFEPKSDAAAEPAADDAVAPEGSDATDGADADTPADDATADQDAPAPEGTDAAPEGTDAAPATDAPDPIDTEQ